MGYVFLDVCERKVGRRIVEVSDILNIAPVEDGCLVSLKSVGVVKVRQTIEDLSRRITEAAQNERKRMEYRSI